MSEQKFDGIIPMGVDIYYTPSSDERDYYAAKVVESFTNGTVSLYVFPCKAFVAGKVVHGCPHKSDARLWKDDGLPSELSRQKGFWWMTPWTEKTVFASRKKGD